MSGKSRYWSWHQRSAAFAFWQLATFSANVFCHLCLAEKKKKNIFEDVDELGCCHHLLHQGGDWVSVPSWIPLPSSTHLLLTSAHYSRPYLILSYGLIFPVFSISLVQTLLDATRCVNYHGLSPSSGPSLGTPGTLSPHSLYIYTYLTWCCK